MRRLFALVLTLAALLGCFAPTVYAETSDKTAKIKDLTASAKTSYYRSLATFGEESFHGYCGKMVSLQLKYLGITKRQESNDGRDQFDYYAAKQKTSGGYYITPYYATDYSLEEALNQISRYGTKDVYNILVGFQWTNSEVGALYGHVVLINGIIDGRVYFVEGFRLSLGRLWEEGSVINCSIRDFDRYYSRWAQYEGCIYFGTKEFSDSCVEHSTDLVIQPRFDSVLRSQPTLLGKEGCAPMRNLTAGERLQAVAIMENRDGDYYYKVTENGAVGYVAASAVSVTQVKADSLEVASVDLPVLAQPEEGIEISGRVVAGKGYVGSVEILVTDNDGNLVLREWAEAGGVGYNLENLNSQLRLDLLPEGNYMVEIFADCANPYVDGRELSMKHEHIRLWGRGLQVGGKLLSSRLSVLSKQTAEVTDGWFYEDGKWRFLVDGKPRTGWIKELNTSYYLDQAGKTLAGWQEVEGKIRYFSETGGMLTGWLPRNNGIYYLGQDGAMVTGWQEIDAKRYYFEAGGILAVEQEITDEQGVVYLLDGNGVATVKPEETTQQTPLQTPAS